MGRPGRGKRIFSRKNAGTGRGKRIFRRKNAYKMHRAFEKTCVFVSFGPWGCRMLLNMHRKIIWALDTACSWLSLRPMDM